MMEAAAAVGEAGKRRKRSWGGGGPGTGLVLGFGRGGGGGNRDAVLMDGFSFSPASSTSPVLWSSRRRPSANAQRSRKVGDEDGIKNHTTTAAGDEPVGKTGGVNNASNPNSASTSNPNSASTAASSADDAPAPMEADANLLEISERRKALFEPLDPAEVPRGRRVPAEELLPPPDFDSVAYPKGWLVGKKRKLVNVDVVESMRRIAVLEMNRKDREIDGLNEQLEEDARCLERLQLQLLEERSRRANVERENAMLKNQVDLLTDMLQVGEEDGAVDGGEDEADFEEEEDGGNSRSS